VTLDLAGLGVLCAGAAVGALAGALRQVVHLGAVALAAALARPLAPGLEGLVGRTGAAPAQAGPVATLAAFLGLFLVLGAAGQLLLRLARRRDGGRSAADRGLGALLGGLHAFVALWAALSLLVLWGRPVGPARWGLDPGRGDLVAFAREHNLLALVAPAQARAVREQLPALRDALERGPLERARQAAEAAERAQRAKQEEAEKAGR